MQLPLPAQPEDLPNWGQIVVYIGVAAGSAIAVVIARLGLISGRRSGSSPDIELAGAVIDKEKADDLIRALEQHGERLERNSDLLEKATDGIGEARQDIRELSREIVRLGSGRRT